MVISSRTWKDTKQNVAEKSWTQLYMCVNAMHRVHVVNRREETIKYRRRMLLVYELTGYSTWLAHKLSIYACRAWNVSVILLSLSREGVCKRGHLISNKGILCFMSFLWYFSLKQNKCEPARFDPSTSSKMESHNFFRSCRRRSRKSSLFNPMERMFDTLSIWVRTSSEL